jgi:deoxyhypusine synthase
MFRLQKHKGKHFQDKTLDLIESIQKDSTLCFEMEYFSILKIGCQNQKHRITQTRLQESHSYDNNEYCI